MEKKNLNTNPRALVNGVEGTFLSLGLRFLNGTSALIVALCLSVSLELMTSLSFTATVQTVASDGSTGEFASEEASAEIPLLVTVSMVADAGAGDGGGGVESCGEEAWSEKTTTEGESDEEEEACAVLEGEG